MDLVDGVDVVDQVVVSGFAAMPYPRKSVFIRGCCLPRPRKLNLGYNLSSATDFLRRPEFPLLWRTGRPISPFSYVGQVAPSLGSAPLRPTNLRVHSCPFVVRLCEIFSVVLAAFFLRGGSIEAV